MKLRKNYLFVKFQTRIFREGTSCHALFGDIPVTVLDSLKVTPLLAFFDKIIFILKIFAGSFLLVSWRWCKAVLELTFRATGPWCVT